MFKLNKNTLSGLIPYAIGASSITIDIGTTGKGANTIAGNLTGLTIGGLIGGLISMIFVLAAIVFFFILVFGGIKWITSGGDEKKVAAARAGITNALIGLAIVFASWAIMNLLGMLFGFNIFNLTFNTFQPTQ